MVKNNIKVLTVVGTRPEIIRLSRVMALLDEHVNQIIAHTGQNYDYELNEIFFQISEKKPYPDKVVNIGGNFVIIQFKEREKPNDRGDFEAKKESLNFNKY